MPTKLKPAEKSWKMTTSRFFRIYTGSRPQIEEIRSGFFKTTMELGKEKIRLISSTRRVLSNVANQPFITPQALADNWFPPYPPDLSLREITLAREVKFYRVHVDIDKPIGRFLTREKEIEPYLHDPEALRKFLGLPQVPIYLTEVIVPAGTSLLAGRIGPQPKFGLMERSGFQYQLTSKIPESSFVNTRPILKFNYNFCMGC